MHRVGKGNTEVGQWCSLLGNELPVVLLLLWRQNILVVWILASMTYRLQRQHRVLCNLLAVAAVMAAVAVVVAVGETR